jgi:hypothetical protein
MKEATINAKQAGERGISAKSVKKVTEVSIQGARFQLTITESPVIVVSSQIQRMNCPPSSLYQSLHTINTITLCQTKYRAGEGEEQDICVIGQQRGDEQPYLQYQVPETRSPSWGT